MIFGPKQCLKFIWFLHNCILNVLECNALSVFLCNSWFWGSFYYLTSGEAIQWTLIRSMSSFGQSKCFNAKIPWIDTFIIHFIVAWGPIEYLLQNWMAIMHSIICNCKVNEQINKYTAFHLVLHFFSWRNDIYVI